MRSPLFELVMLSSLGLGACGGGGDGGTATPDATVAIDAEPVQPAPTGEDIHFQVNDGVRPGRSLLINDWTRSPNHLYALDPNDLGGGKQDVLQVNRLWSLGASDGETLLFAAFDEEQTAHFGVTFGDSIQNTFIWHGGTQTVQAVSWGNINDECHQFDATGEFAYVCRRYDFQPDGSSSGYRLGRIKVADGTFEFLRPAQTTTFELSPQPIGTTGTVLFETRNRPPATGGAIRLRDLSTGVETLVRDHAIRPVLAPDGHRVAFQDLDQQRHVFILDLAAPAAAPVAVTTASVGDLVWEPEGQAIVYTVYDDAHQCDSLEQVAIAAGVPQPPVRVRECTDAGHGEFITALAWMTILE